jgi:hypothetical protein
MERQQRKVLSEVLKEAWKDPTFRAGMVEKQSAAMKGRWTDPEKREAMMASREGHGERMRKLWADPEWRSMMEEKRRVQSNNKETRKKLSETQKVKWSDPKYKERMTRLRKEQAKVPDEVARKKETAKELWEDPKYRIAQMHARRDAEMYGAKWRAKVSVGSRLAVKEGRKICWNKGLTKHTDKRLMKASKRMQGKIPDYKKMRRWYPSDAVHKIWMRAAWEVGYALYLDGKGIEWMYEQRKFFVGEGPWDGVTYAPDFYLPETGWFVEIKGREDDKFKNKFAEFRKRHPGYRVKILRRAQLRKKGVIDMYGRAVYLGKRKVQ